MKQSDILRNNLYKQFFSEVKSYVGVQQFEYSIIRFYFIPRIDSLYVWFGIIVAAQTDVVVCLHNIGFKKKTIKLWEGQKSV
jgi:hypothetical protein